MSTSQNLLFCFLNTYVYRFSLCIYLSSLFRSKMFIYTYARHMPVLQRNLKNLPNLLNQFFKDLQFLFSLRLPLSFCPITFTISVRGISLFPSILRISLALSLIGTLAALTAHKYSMKVCMGFHAARWSGLVLTLASNRYTVV